MEYTKLNDVIVKCLKLSKTLSKTSNNDYIDKISFDVGVFHPTNLVKRRNNLGEYTKANLLSKNISLEKYKYSLGKNDIDKRINSVIVLVFFSSVAFDYFVTDVFTPIMETYMNEKYGFSYYDDRILKKEAAVYAGLGKIGRNSLLFSNKFGFNCKISVILSEVKFNNYYEFPDAKRYRYELCENCYDCVINCPVNCKMSYNLVDYNRCDINLPFSERDPDDLCRNCISSCKASNRLLADIPQELVNLRFL